jgi:hypothetical protein
MKLNHGHSAFIVSVANVLTSSSKVVDFGRVLVMNLWLLFGLMVDRHSTSLNGFIEIMDMILLILVALDLSTRMAVLAHVPRGEHLQRDEPMVLRGVLLICCFLDLLLSIFVNGYWRAGLYLRAVYVASAPNIQETQKLLTRSLVNCHTEKVLLLSQCLFGSSKRELFWECFSSLYGLALLFSCFYS